MRIRAAVSAAALLLVAASASAQDSVSISGCFPGDAVAPWSDVFGPFQSEQCDQYVVDLTPITSSWGNPFGVAPVVKSGKTNSLFFNSLTSGNGISRDLLTGRKFSATTYAFWNQPGFGVNNDVALNMPGTAIETDNLRGVQFGITFAESGLTDNNANYQGAVTAVVNIDPSNPRRLYVNKVQAATNSCDNFSDLAAIAAGSVDANGNTVVRADGFGVLFGGCSLVPLPPGNPNNNIFLIDALARTCAFLNIVSDSTAGYDTGAMKRLVSNALDAHTTPGLVPESIHGGGSPLYIGVNFANQYVYGTMSPTTSTGTYLDPSSSGGSRGNISYMSRNFGLLGSTGGVCAVLGVSTATDALNIWGINGTGAVTGVISAKLPAVVIDGSTGFVNAGPGPNQFDHYHSQVAFQGGNGQVALGVDGLGNLLAAAEVDHPDGGADNQWGGNYIAVCRIDPVSGTESWTMAGYIDPATTNGKPILDGPNGTPIWQMKQLIPGPSVSSPMIDAAGNVYFLSFMEKLDGSAITALGLIKAVYNPAAFSYQLELVLKTGDVIAGQNSGRDFLITSLRLLDSNSIGSDAPYSQNITERGFLGYDGNCFAPADSRTTGGIAVAANVVYDHNNDGQFDGTDCVSAGSTDEQYRVMLYVGSLGTSGIQTHGVGCAGTGGFVPGISWSGYPSSGKTITFSLDNALGGQTALLFITPFGAAQVPVGGGCFLNIASPFVGPFSLPLFGSGAGNGAISISTALPVLPPGAKLSFQAFCTDPGTTLGASATKGLTVTFQ